MDRKTVLTAVGAIALTVVAASSAMAVNLGILDAEGSDNVGDLNIRPLATAPADPPASSTTVELSSGADATTTITVPVATTTAVPGVGEPPAVPPTTAPPAAVATRPPTQATSAPRATAAVTTTAAVPGERGGRAKSKDADEPKAELPDRRTGRLDDD